VRAARAVYLDYEQGERLARERFQRFARGRGMTLPELAALGDQLGLGPHPDVFLDDARAEDAYARLAEGARLVVVDSLRAAAHLADENDSTIRNHIDVLGRVSEKTGAVVVFIHHTRKPSQNDAAAGRYAIRGSSAIYDACSSVFMFTGSENHEQPTRVRHAKCRNRGILLEDFGLTVEDVEIDGNARAGLRLLYLTTEQIGREGSDVDAGKKPDPCDRIRAVFESTPMFKGTREELREKVKMGAGPFREALGTMLATGELTIETGADGIEFHYHAWAGA
jgi:hypothetical protein